MHFSVQPDAARPLDASHDYQIMNLESQGFSFYQIDVRTGAENVGKIVVNGNSKTAGSAPTLFTAGFTGGTFQNFALKMDFDANTVQVFHRVGDEPLQSVMEAVPNGLAGNGEYRFALQKNPIGVDGQEANIDEGIIFGGIFMEGVGRRDGCASIIP